MRNVDISDIIKTMNKLGHVVFEKDLKPYNLNIVGIRSENPKADEFNDLMCVFWKYEGHWNMIKMQCTTLAGLHWMVNPMHPKGCAALMEGQWRSCWAIGMHFNYKALTQVKPVTCYRDDDKDMEYDLDDKKTLTGLFGINIHRAHPKYEMSKVGKFSAGCQVIQNPHEFDVFMSLMYESAEVWGNSFTYTLIKESDIS